MSNYTKRLENRIRKVDGKYYLTTHKVFVPHKGSKVRFRETAVDAINCLVTTYGTPPAHRDLKGIYEEALGNYYALMKPYKKLKKKINRRNRQRSVA